jgi:hypothetical protein
MRSENTVTTRRWTFLDELNHWHAAKKDSPVYNIVLQIVNNTVSAENTNSFGVGVAILNTSGI